MGAIKTCSGNGVMPLCSFYMCILHSLQDLCRVLILAISSDILIAKLAKLMARSTATGLAGALGAALLRAHALFCASQLWVGRPADLGTISWRPGCNYCVLQRCTALDKVSVLQQDWQVPLGRRFRALKLWFVLRSYGRAGLQDYLRHHLALAATVEARVRADPRFELAAPPRFALVCFRLKAWRRPSDPCAFWSPISHRDCTFHVATSSSVWRDFGGTLTDRCYVCLGCHLAAGHCVWYACTELHASTPHLGDLVH